MIFEQYQNLIKNGEIVADTYQEKAAKQLQRLEIELLNFDKFKNSLFTKILRKKQNKPPGLYLYGPVGRGKTFLMDLFFDNTIIKAKERMHFYRFMKLIHENLNKQKDREDPINLVAKDLSSQINLLCLDELIVEDIGDAMILGALFGLLTINGTVIITTSNSHPSDLYKNGLQRDRFLPAINFIQEHMKVLNLIGDEDYRLSAIQDSKTFLLLSPKEDHDFTSHFSKLTKNKIIVGSSIAVLGREINYRMRSQGYIWFDFDEICSGPRSQNDYIEISSRFHTVFISGIHQLDKVYENEARRFMSLIDEFYDRHVNLFIMSEVPLNQIYNGTKLINVFQRTVSRIEEMQSSEYLSLPHLA